MTQRFLYRLRVALCMLPLIPAMAQADRIAIMDEGQILIVNLSKGRIGEDASALLGSLLVTNLQLAAMRRNTVCRIPPLR